MGKKMVNRMESVIDIGGIGIIKVQGPTNVDECFEVHCAS